MIIMMKKEKKKGKERKRFLYVLNVIENLE